jgi:hypothetical protein
MCSSWYSAAIYETGHDNQPRHAGRDTAQDVDSDQQPRPAHERRNDKQGRGDDDPDCHFWLSLIFGPLSIYLVQHRELVVSYSR